MRFALITRLECTEIIVETYLTREEALRNKWRCEKCSERFRSYRMLYEHKIQIHSY